MKIIVDTREQKPVLKGERKTLKVGDYTTDRLFGIFHIERKSPQDLYGSIIQGHNRFRRMLLRARELKIGLVIMVECQEKRFYEKSWPGAHRLQTKGETLKRIVETMYWKYGVEFIWCNSRTSMKKEITKLLDQNEKQNLQLQRKSNSTNNFFCKPGPVAEQHSAAKIIKTANLSKPPKPKKTDSTTIRKNKREHS